MQSEFYNNASGMVLAYLKGQREKVNQILRGEIYVTDDPRYDLAYRHEADKLYMLESLAIDAGLDMKRTIDFIAE